MPDALTQDALITVARYTRTRYAAAALAMQLMELLRAEQATALDPAKARDA